MGTEHIKTIYMQVEISLTGVCLLSYANSKCSAIQNSLKDRLEHIRKHQRNDFLSYTERMNQEN